MDRGRTGPIFIVEVEVGVTSNARSMLLNHTRAIS
jgi:hypothetical protein